MRDEFPTAFPDDPAADQASLAVATALLELKAYRQAIERSARFAKRFAGSDYLDSFWYVSGYGNFALGKADEGVARCRKVAEHQRTDRATGREVAALNK